MNIIEIINKLEEENKRKKIAPSHVLFIPLLRECIDLGITREELSAELNKLFKDGKIKVGRTINDKHISVV